MLGGTQFHEFISTVPPQDELILKCLCQSQWKFNTTDGFQEGQGTENSLGTHEDTRLIQHGTREQDHQLTWK